MMDLFAYKLHQKLRGDFSFERACAQEVRRVLGSTAHLIHCKGQSLPQTCKLGWSHLGRNKVGLIKQTPYPILICFSGYSSRSELLLLVLLVTDSHLNFIESLSAEKQ